MTYRYRLLGRLEPGELAELYKAIRSDGTPVVVKLFHQKTSDPRYARELAETARVLNPLSHEAIVHFLDIGMVRGRLAVVREFVDGHTLGVGLQRLGTREVLLPPAVALHVIIELCEAVGTGHEAGLIHGAITPGNVLLARDGRSLVGDFGALRALQASPALKGFVQKGRSSYRAPEVVRGDPVSFESDIYSLGAIAYELLTLRELDSGKSVSVRREAVMPPSRVDRRINARLDPIVMRAVEPTPARRFRSSQELTAALRNFLSANGGMPTKDDVRKFVAELFPSEVKVDGLGPVPFDQEFELSEVSGADLRAPGEAELGGDSRPAFTGEHQFSLPPAPVRASRSRPAVNDPRPAEQEPPEEEDPDRTRAAEWEAPPSNVPPKAARQRGAPGEVPAATSQAIEAVRARVRQREDESSYEPLSGEEVTIPPPVARSSKALKAVRETFARPEKPAALAEVRPADTFLKKLAVVRDRKRSGAVLAVSLALLGAGILGYAVWHWSRQPAASTQPEFVGAPPPTPIRPRALAPVELRPPTDPRPVIPTEPEPPRGIHQLVDREAPVPNEGYLTILCNVPARLYVDGVRMKGQTPFKKLAVSAGSRHLALESVGTGERTDFNLTFARGQTRKVEQHFLQRPHTRR